jgi:hypothetical protein
VAKNDSATALSKQSPLEPIERWMPISRQRSPRNAQYGGRRSLLERADVVGSTAVAQSTGLKRDSPNRHSMSDTGVTRHRRRWASGDLWERLLLDVPWGVLVFLLLVVVGGFVWTLVSSELKAGDYLTAVGGGAGLLAVGHGIRTHGKRRAP